MQMYMLLLKNSLGNAFFFLARAFFKRFYIYLPRNLKHIQI